MPGRDSDELPRGYVLALATSAALSIAILPTRGMYRADAMVFLFVALGLVLLQLPALVARSRGLAPANANANASRAASRAPSVRQRAVVLGSFVTLAGFTGIQLVDQKLLANAHESWWTVRVLLAIQLGLLASYLAPPSGDRARDARWRTTRFALLGAVTLLAALEAIRLVPTPPIDVWDVQMQGARALLHGQNPFEVVKVRDTAPGSTRMDIPYVYPPLQLLLTIPSVLLGDARYTMALAVVAIGFAVRSVARSSGRALHPLVEDAPALFVWFSPKLLHVIEQAWIDPVQVALIAAAAALAFRRRRIGAALVLGLVLASKQSMFWVFPIMAVAFGFTLRELALAVAVPAIVYAPFALWNFDALAFANVGIQVSLAPRDDALTFVVWARRVLGIAIPPATGFVLALVVVIAVFVRRRRPALYGVAVATTYFVFFAFNKWAFANYYFLIGSAFALGAATWLHAAPARAPAPTEGVEAPRAACETANG
jgi:hypothetical protein